MKHTILALTVALGSLLGATALEAQVDSNLLRREWRPEKHWADTYDKLFFVQKGPVQDSDHDFGIFHWDSFGRIKVDAEERDPSFWIGYKFLTIDISSGDSRIDTGLYDVGVAFGAKLASLGGGWTLEGAGGAATANDGAWSNTDALYPTLTLSAVHEIAEHEFLHLGVTYDGNSALLPAVPLPLIEYEARVNPSLRLRVGFPHAEVEWSPLAGLSLLAILEYPTDARLHLELALGGGFRVYTEGVRRIDGFHLRESGRERVFYQMHTAELGLRFANSWLDLSLFGGYAFGQEFFTGYDLRDRENAVSPGNRPLVGLTMQGVF